MYKLKFLGAGSAFCNINNNFQSNMVITAPSGKRFLVDCGTQCMIALDYHKIPLSEIDSVYISHLHADHTGGMEEIAFKTYFTKNHKNLYVHGALVESLWYNTLKGGLSSIEGELLNLKSYFKVHTIKRNGTFKWEDLEFRTINVVHIMNGYEVIPSYGLMFVINGKKIFITTDTQFAPNQLIAFYKEADLIYHDCETTKFKSGVHAHYNELKTLAPEFKSKMWLYHYSDDNTFNAVEDGFLGFVQRGQEFDF